MGSTIDRLRSRLVHGCDGSVELASLIAVNVAVWLVCMILTLAGGEGIVMSLLCLPADPGLFITHPWTLLTYMVTQLSVIHLLFNVLWLYWFGRIILTTMSGRHILRLYIGGGVTGGVLYLLYALTAWSGHIPGTLCGASAAVLAIMTAAAIRTPDYRINLFIIGEVKLKWLALASILLTFLGAGGGMSGAQSAHLGGIIYGAASGFALRRGFRLSSLWGKIWRKPGKSNDSPRRKGDKVAGFLKQREEERQRLDELLDKINISGYDSLSRREKKELTAISQRLDKGNR